MLTLFLVVFYPYFMKKLIIFILIFLISLTSLSAAKEYLIFGAGSGWNSAVSKPEAGMYLQYQFGAQLSSSFSLGGGSFLVTDFPIKSSLYVGTVNATMGPAVSIKLTEESYLTSIIGFDVMVLAQKTGSPADDKFGYGVGAAVTYNFIPLSEKESRVEMGLSLGLNGSLTFYEDSPAPFISARAFVGFILTQPLIAVYYPDRYYTLYPLYY